MEKEAILIKPTIPDIIKEVHESGKLVPDLMKCENGNNFRAISEKAILDVLDPILEEQGIFYTVFIKDAHLEIREAYGAKGKKLQFIAWMTVDINFYDKENHYLSHIESAGMGIDDNDKAMGKAYTYAFKYGLLKFFRFRYGDDPDFEASTPLITEFRGEKKEAEPKEWAKKADKKPAKKSSKTGSALMTESQRDYILGMMKDKKVEASQVIEEFDINPVKDKEIPMDVARDIIKWLKDEEFMPF